MNTASYPPLAHILWPTSARGGAIARGVALAWAGALLLTVSAKIQIPFYPVPQTLQTMIVVLLGMSLGAKLGTATVLLYLSAGLAGLPVFAGTPEKGIGLAYMLGPTGGYLLGFVPAAAACGMLARRGFDQSVLMVAAAMVAGNAIIYVPGLLWLGIVIDWGNNSVLLEVLKAGMFPFVLGDLAKIAFAALLLPPLARVVRRR